MLFLVRLYSNRRTLTLTKSMALLLAWNLFVASLVLPVSCTQEKPVLEADNSSEHQSTTEHDWPVDAEDSKLRLKLGELIEATALHPHDDSPIGELAMTYDANGFRESAELAYKHAIRLAPKSFEWHYLLSLRVKKNGDLRQAIQLAQNSVRLNPEYGAVHLRLGSWQLDYGDVHAAQRSFRRAKALQIGPAADLGLARIHLKQGEYVDAFLLLNDLVSRTEHPAALRLLAQSWRAAGDEATARGLLKNTTNGSNDMWYADPIAKQVQKFAIGKRHGIQAAQQLLANGQLKEALNTVKLLESPIKPDFDVQYHLGLVYTSLQQHNQALPHLLKAVELEPHHYPAHLLIAANYQQSGDNQSALGHLERVVAIYPNLQVAHQELGFVRLQLGDQHGALASFKDAIRFDSIAPQVHYLAGAILGERDQCQEAINYFENALLLNPSHEKAQQGLKVCLDDIAQYSSP